MSGKEETSGWGLSSEQYDEDKVLEVDTRSVDYERLRAEAKHPHGTWAEGPEGTDAEGTDADAALTERGEPTADDAGDTSRTSQSDRDDDA